MRRKCCNFDGQRSTVSGVQCPVWICACVCPTAARLPSESSTAGAARVALSPAPLGHRLRAHGCRAREQGGTLAACGTHARSHVNKSDSPAAPWPGPHQAGRAVERHHRSPCRHAHSARITCAATAAATAVVWSIALAYHYLLDTSTVGRSRAASSVTPSVPGA